MTIKSKTTSKNTKVNYFSKIKYGLPRIIVVLTDKKRRCWKFKVRKDMILKELNLNIEEQFYK